MALISFPNRPNRAGIALADSLPLPGYGHFSSNGLLPSLCFLGSLSPPSSVRVEVRRRMCLWDNLLGDRSRMKAPPFWYSCENVTALLFRFSRSTSSSTFSLQGTGARRWTFSPSSVSHFFLSFRKTYRSTTPRMQSKRTNISVAGLFFSLP